MNKPEVPVVCPSNQQQWREWLQAHHDQDQSVWLVYYKKTSTTPTLSWSEAVDEALCFGWIDSQAKPLDDEKYQQFFSRRKPKSGWSKVNKEKVKRLIAEGKMMPAGITSIETAQQNGSWTLLDEVEALQLPADLKQAFVLHPEARTYFMTLCRTAKRQALLALVLAKRPATRQQRIRAILELANHGVKPA
ncbi:YdeI/OmpD-associated family protein [Hymenobacter sp. AT01-02]|uniref:YdeI/OmpD-associated family protein n=1 Tax=Hymenobacter sp. AT01-02 TaxID=1571877 RepID=UPI0005F1609D|nr:YdeI/OmpD-associated family protein [Hymenobacter sp. AT01-02]